jgi:hypothetical protein
MRLSHVLSKPPDITFVEVDDFLKTPLADGKQRQIDIGSIGLNFYCKKCDDTRTFWSTNKLYCIGVNHRQVSVDCVLKCECGVSVAIWFLVESYEEEISGRAPNVRILKRREKLSEQVRLVGGQYTDLLDKSLRAYRDGLGAGAMVYLRKILENITVQTANGAGISYNQHNNGNPKNFKELLKKVDAQCSIIPTEFAADGYRLFSELSDVVHGQHDENLALQKFEPLHRLVVGILDNINNKQAINTAKASLGWNAPNGGITP